MNRLLIWDLPTRLFHWLLVAGVATAFVLAWGAEEESPLFSGHMLVALALIPLLLFRIFWGVAGSKYARFRSFWFRPAEVGEYLKGMMSFSAPRHLGHNPAAAYAMIALMVLACGGIATGLLNTKAELFEDLHQAVAYALLGVVGAHLVGIIGHQAVHRENLVLSMFTGKKKAADGEGIASSHPLGALILAVACGAWAWTLAAHYDPGTRQLHAPFLKASIQLGGKDHREGAGHGAEEDHD